MPIITVKKNGKTVGYKWGQSGKVYKRRADAEKQGLAIRLSQARRGKHKSAKDVAGILWEFLL